MSLKMTREQYSQMFGPTTGDSVRLGDTNLFARIEKDYTTYGEEVAFGGGKQIRDGMAQDGLATRSTDERVPDTVITNALIIDYTGIYKADIGIRDGKISKIGKAGNPRTQDGVDIVIAAGTEVISGEGKIITAGGIDTHIHFINPHQAWAALSGGVTTMIGGGASTGSGSSATTCTPGPWHIKHMLRAVEGIPVNVGLFGKGHAAAQGPLTEQIRAGAFGLKIHEDWASTPSVIDQALKCGDAFDIQIAIHSDTLNESGFYEDTIKAFQGRTIHTFHTEGAGGGHAPDIIRAAGELNVLPAATNPTIPYTVNTVDEHLDMVMVAHNLNPSIPEDLAFAESRIRKESIGAEDILIDMGVFSIVSSDSQAMGRISEMVTRSWQLAHKMKDQIGSLKGDSKHNDNNRIKRYIAKYTINPAIAHGISNYIGSVEEGKYADLVIWDPQFFGAKPDTILKNGSVVTHFMGDANASIPTPEPRIHRDMFGQFGSAMQYNKLTFVSNIAYENGIKDELDLKSNVVPCSNTRELTKKDMKLNDALPKLEVDPQTYDVYADGKKLYSEPVSEVPLGQRYFLF